jgi:serine/threonine protein kinase/Tol biopolymer transport system component
MPISVGQKIGPYEVLSSIGAGGMGEVYRARDTRLGRVVALKILPAEFSRDRERLERFEQEAHSASALNHPNIITIYDIGSSNSTSYLSMELVEGKSLRALLDEGLMPLRKIVSIASQLANGLAKAHSAGIVHRDLKPDNLMISKDGFLKILDFGLAKMTLVTTTEASHLQTQTAAGGVVGTVGYMSPEQASGKAVDFHSDQFSFGTILYEMIAGKRPFQRGSVAESMAAIIREDPEPVQNLNLQIPQILRWILDRCMAKDPEERYASTRDLARDLQSIRDHISELSSVATVSAVPQPGKRFRSRVPLLVLIAFLAGAAAAYWYFKPKPQEPFEMLTLTFSGKDSSPAVSPDGKLIAFRSDRDGKPRIWLKQLAGGNEIVLSSGPDDYPRFSADSSTIFFIRRQGASTSLYRISVLGGEVRQILDDVHSADLSPDGKRIVFVRWKSEESSLFTANVNGTGVELVTPIEKIQVQFPRWSRDGKRIIATRNWAGNAVNLDAILIVDLKTKEKRWIRSTWPTAAIWISRNQILYGVPRSANASTRMAGTIVLQDIDSEKIQKLFSFSSCGDVLDRLDRHTLLLQSSVRRQNLRQISLAESRATGRWFTRGNITDRQPVYSPDGKRILYSSIGSGNLDLMETTIETGAVKRITEDAVDDWDPAYTPDGRHIVWSSNRDGHFEIWMANSDGSDSRRITNDGLDAENPTMTPDQQWILYNSYNPKKMGVWKIHPDGSGATQLIKGLTQQPEVSPDGNYVAYAWYKQSAVGSTSYIRIADIQTGNPVPFEVKSEHGRSRWMPDGKSLAYIDSNERGDLGIFVQDFIPGQDTFATRRAIAGFDPDKQTETFAISPDGKFITLAESELLFSLVRVENVPGL